MKRKNLSYLQRAETGRRGESTAFSQHKGVREKSNQKRKETSSSRERTRTPKDSSGKTKGDALRGSRERKQRKKGKGPVSRKGSMLKAPNEGTGCMKGSSRKFESERGGVGKRSILQ